MATNPQGWEEWLVAILSSPTDFELMLVASDWCEDNNMLAMATALRFVAHRKYQTAPAYYGRNPTCYLLTSDVATTSTYLPEWAAPRVRYYKSQASALMALLNHLCTIYTQLLHPQASSECSKEP